MQPISLVSDKGVELSVGVTGRGKVWVTVQNVRASVVTELNHAQADLLGRALLQACAALRVQEAQA